MIVLTRLNGAKFSLNDEQIERLEDGPNTVVVLVNGNRYTALESMSEVIDAIVDFRARVLDAASLSNPARSRSMRDASISLFRSHSIVDEDNITGEGPEEEEDPGFTRPPSLRSTLFPKRGDDKR